MHKFTPSGFKNTVSTIALLGGLMASASSAHAASSSRLTITNYTSLGNVCRVSFESDVTWQRGDPINGIATTDDFVVVFGTENGNQNIIGNGAGSTGGVGFRIPRNQTQTITGNYDFESGDVGLPPLGLAIAESGPTDIIRQTSMDLSAMNAAGGECAAAATRAGFGNQPPIIDFSSIRTSARQLTFSQVDNNDIEVHADQSSDPENRALTYNFTYDGTHPLWQNGQTYGQQDPNQSSTYRVDFPNPAFAREETLNVNLELSDGVATTRDTISFRVVPDIPTNVMLATQSGATRFLDDRRGNCVVQVLVDVIGAEGQLQSFPGAPAFYEGDNFRSAVGINGATPTNSGLELARVGRTPLNQSFLGVSIPRASTNIQNAVMKIEDLVPGNNNLVKATPFTKVIPITDFPTTGICGDVRANSIGNATNNTLPVADAGTDQQLTVAPGDTINLTGAASTDADGDALTYRWRQVAGTSVSLSDATLVNPSFSYAPPAGQTEVLAFELIVNDGTIDSSSSVVEIELTRANSAPTADAGRNQAYRNVNNSTVVTLDGSASSDPDANTTLTYQWTQVSGSTVTLSDPTVAMPTFTGFTPNGAETLIFELVVSDGALTSTADSIEVVLSSTSSLPPTARIVGPTAPVTINNTPGQSFTLSANRSSDPDFDPLTFQWTQISGPETLSVVNGTSFTDADIELGVPATPGAYVFEVTVSDGITPPVAQSFTVTIAPANSAPVANAGPNQSLNVAASTIITLDGSGSTDADNDPLTYRWRQTAGTSVTLSDANAVNPTFSYLPAATETLTFELIVNDGSLDSAAATVDIVLTPGVTTATLNAVSFREGVSGCTFSAPFTFQGFTDDGNSEDNFRIVVTSGTSTVSAGTPLDSSTTVGQSTSGLFNQAFSVPANTATPLFLSLLNLDGSSTPTSILTQSPIDLNAVAAIGPSCRTEVKSIRGNQVPVANAGPNQTVNNVNSNTTVTLDATASTDADSDSLTYRWVQTSGPTVTLNNPTTATPSFVFVPAMMDTLTFDVFVSDGTDESPADSVEIVLNRANVLPVANAGSNQALRTARPGATQTPQTLTLDGTLSTDSDGDALTYRWSQVAGPALTLSSGASLTDAQPVFEAPNQEGTVTFQLIVNDGFGDSAPVTVDAVYTFFDNEAPVAQAGPDQTVGQAVGVVSVTLAGSATDPENDALSYAWTQVSGPSVTLSDATLTNPSFTFDMSGITTDQIFVFALTAQDAALSSQADEVTIRLTPNAIPVADAGSDQNLSAVTASTVITLDGSASSDGDGDALTYMWTQVSGPAVTLSDATAASPTFSYDPGTNTSSQSFVFDLVVNDGRVSSQADRVEIVAVPNNAPVANAGPAQTQPVYVAGAPVQLDGRSSSDPNGDQLQYQWVQLSGPAVTLDNPNSATPSFTYVPAANRLASALKASNAPVAFSFGLTVTDGVLASAQSQVSVTLTVNDPPEADAGADQTLQTPADGTVITLDGSGSSDPEGDALTYNWVQVSGRAITLSDVTAVSPTFAYDYPTPLPAEETFTFALTINDGNQNSQADEVTITVINNQMPVANAGQDIGPINSGDLVTLNGGASSDPDGDNLTYAWSQVSGPAVTLSDATAQSPTFTAPDVTDLSNLVFELVVNDGRVNSVADQVTVSIQPVGSIRVVQRVTGSDGTFTYTSTAAGLNGTLTTTGGLGELVATRIGTGIYTLTARDERDQGYALTAISCSDDDSTTTLSTRQATIRLAPGEDVTCTFDVVNSREAATKAIRTALVARSQLILASEPSSQRRIDRLKGQSQAGSGARIAGLTVPGTNKLGLSASLSPRSLELSGSLHAANAQGLLEGQLDKATHDGKFDVWGQAQFQGFDFQGTDGDFSIIYMGADYLVSENVLIGGLVQLDDFSYNDVDNAGYVAGNGFMAGPYATVKLGDRLYVDARAAWGSSDNTVNPLGSFTDEFDTDRALYATSITGEWTFDNNLNVRPELSVRHLSETQKTYTDKLGVAIPEQTVDLGELAFGPRFSKPIIMNRRWTMTPYGEIKGVYNFGDAVQDVLQSETRLRLEGGADWNSDNGVRVGLNGFTDGIGSDDLESFGLRVSLSYTME